MRTTATTLKGGKIRPVLLGSGLRLFEHAGAGPVQLERFKVMELPSGRTHLRFRVIK